MLSEVLFCLGTVILLSLTGDTLGTVEVEDCVEVEVSLLIFWKLSRNGTVEDVEGAGVVSLCWTDRAGLIKGFV